MNTLLMIGMLFFGYMFLTSSFGKIKEFSEHQKIIKAYKILPLGLTKSFAILDIGFEIIVGVALLTLMIPELSTILASSLLLVYSIAIAVNLFRGRTDLDCGCGGIVGDNKISPILVLRNIILIGVLTLIGFGVKSEALTGFTQLYWIVNLLMIQFILLIYASRHLMKLKNHYNQIGGFHE